MKINFKKKWICVVLVLTVTLQSCRVYHKTPISLDEATAIGRKTQVVYINGSKCHYKKIEKIDKSYYGVLRQSNAKIVTGEDAKKDGIYSESAEDMTRVPLNEDDIESVRILDRTSTTVANIVMVIGPLVTIALLLVTFEDDIAAAALAN